MHQTRIDEYPLTLTVKEVSKIMRIGLRQTYEMIRRKDFPKLKNGNRIIIPRDAFWTWYNTAANQNDAV